MSSAGETRPAGLPHKVARRWTGPLTVHPQGSGLARALMALFGWKVVFAGLPGRQGVVMVYPHTSNWDFVIGVMTKWTLGLQVRFWGKDSLFKVPLFGAWLRWLGGVAVNRRAASGLVGQTVEQVRAARARDELFWLAVAPEGTRSYAQGWRSGAYQVAVQAGVPVGLAYFDFATRTVGFTEFVEVSGDPEQDFALFAQVLQGRRGKRPELASPIRLKP
ncbi:1-acyl-sn-glycerol-3-phosphate acyltransferase [Pelomonas sp. CA6]|uniref:1-acyl-sn-glycerol-3-phosphate acyltransferase n=1 Tax=Pelomonas sp. CA6 TaxID=2907999 RepID=UPI001F4ADDE0|nr:1-acyl-sn-glycerol-3-phosphate acyltransferase [Pelomonas sp. CA6]MCH7342393.1 1-acyl-sn-glycerol-3-phosphate acyltransferase [Pelomonas sp. CA6]